MELFLLKAVALFRPLASMEFASAIFEIAGIGFFALLVGALLISSAVRKSLSFSAIDAAIITFSVWCAATYLIYFDLALIKEVAKLLIPLLGFVVVKNVVRERSEYVGLLRWALVGFAVPILLSAALIANGQGVDYVSYWTDVARWRGAYEGSHSLGHSMTLFVLILVVYVRFRSSSAAPRGGGLLMEKILFGGLAAVALYCLYMSQVRSAVVGLMVFAAMYLYFVNRKLLVMGAVALGVLTVVTIPYWVPALLPEFAMRERGIEVDTMDLGSGRPNMWLNDLKVFADAPIDQKLAGLGIGNRGARSGDARNANFVIYGHNDWLELLTQTGVIGVALFAWLQIAILRRILRLPLRDKYLYLALFSAVNVMMVVSNSYAWRIQVSQLYYMILAYIEAPPSLSDAAASDAPTVPAADHLHAPQYSFRRRV